MNGTKTIKLKVNKNLPGYAAGQTVTVSTDADGTPHSQFWRKRLLDAKTDKCVEEVKPEAKSKKESPKEDTK